MATIEQMSQEFGVDVISEIPMDVGAQIMRRLNEEMRTPTSKELLRHIHRDSSDGIDIWYAGGAIVKVHYKCEGAEPRNYERAAEIQLGGKCGDRNSAREYLEMIAGGSLHGRNKTNT